MKIGIDITPIIYPYFGAGVYTRELSSWLVRLFPEEEFVFLGYSLRAGKKLWRFIDSLDGERGGLTAEFYPFPVSLMEVLWNRWHRLPVERLTGQIDLFHASDWIQPPALGRVVTTVHDLAVWLWPQTFPPRIVENQKRRMEHVKKEARLVIADSQATKKDLIEILGFEESRIRVVYLGVDHQRFLATISPQEIERVQKKYQILKPYFLVLGTRNPRKNLDRVVKAFVLGRERGKLEDFNLVVSGRFGWGEETKEEKGIQLTGFVDSADLPALYAGAKALVFPSLYEGFGLPVLEALACGTPVITSKAGSLAEVSGQAALYVDPESVEEITLAMEKVAARGEKEKRALKEKAIAQAKRFSWAKCAQETFAVYQEVIGIPN
jgi:glycosyltransferase involved in cell wall biosynthesis